jgi:hypothetical protein
MLEVMELDSDSMHSSKPHQMMNIQTIESISITLGTIKTAQTELQTFS